MTIKVKNASGVYSDAVVKVKTATGYADTLVKTKTAAGVYEEVGGDIFDVIFADASPGLHLQNEEAIKVNEAALGPELVVNGDFSDGTTGWLPFNGAILTNTGGELQVTATSATYAYGYQQFTCEIGKTYAFVGVGRRSGGATSAWINVGQSANATEYGTLTLGAENTSVSIAVFTARHSNIRITLQTHNSGAGVGLAVSKASLREIDLSKCRAFQDTQGTLPVVAMEQPLGLVLDNSQGLVRGPELNPDVGFDNPAAWSFIGVGWEVSGGKAVVSATHTGNRWLLTATARAVVGRWYEVEFDAVVTAGSVAVDMTSYSPRAITASGHYRMIVLSITASIQLIARPTFIGSVDNLSVRELSGNHLIQPSNSAGRPVVSRKVNLLPTTNDLTSTSWGKNELTVTPELDGTFSVTKASTSSSRAISGASSASTYAGATYVATVDLYAGNSTIAHVGIGASTDAVGDTWGHATTNSAEVISGPGTLTGSSFWYINNLSVEVPTRIRITRRYSNAGLGVGLYVYPGGSGGNPVGTSTRVKNPDLRLASDATPSMPIYQAVRSATDYDQVGFPVKVVCDGVDDWTESSAINPAGATDVTLVMSVQQLRALGASGCLFEFGPDSSTTAGTFGLFGPGNSGASQLTAVVRGTSTTSTQIVSGTPLAVGSKAVVSLMFSLTTGRLRIRINGAQVLDVVTSATGGTFSSQKAYIGRRAGSSLPSKASTFGHTLVFKALTDAQIAAIEAKHRSNGKVY